MPVGSYRRARRVGAYLVRGAAGAVAVGQADAAVFLNSRGGRLSRQSRLDGARTRRPSGPG